MNEKPTRPSERAPDPRPARTRAAILAAIERLGARDVELNVASIVKEAGLSRSSFYSQFKDVGDVAVQSVERLLEELIENDSALRGRHEGTDLQITLLTIDRFLSEFHARRALFSALFGAGSGSCQRDACEIMTRISLPAFRRNAPGGVDPEFAARFLAAGTLVSMVEWVLTEKPVPLDEMKQRLFSMMPAWVSAPA